MFFIVLHYCYLLSFIANEYQCVCHTFYQDLALNSWKVVFVFVPSEVNLEVSYMIVTMNKICVFLNVFVL